VKASDFARWAGPRAAQTENVATAVTVVADELNSRPSAGFGCDAAVTMGMEGMVTAVTVPPLTASRQQERGAIVEYDGGIPPEGAAGSSRHKPDMVAPGRDSWSAADWEAFYDKRARIAELDGGLPRLRAAAFAFACCELEWLNRNFVPSQPGRCVVCDGDDRFDNPLLPCCGTGATGHAWVHDGCWPAWHAGRKAAAVAALAAMGLQRPAVPGSDD